MKKYWDKIEIGHALSPLSKKPTSRLNLAQFAAASDDFSPLHLDDEYAKGAGFGSVFVPSLIALGITEDAIRAFAHNALLVSLTGTFQRLMWPGDTLTAKGVVVRRYKNHEEHRLQFSLWVENQNKEVVMKGQAVLILFKNSEDEHQAKSQLPAISQTAHEALIEKCDKIGSTQAAHPSRTLAPRELA
jgi:acyl dehydratase